MENQFTFVFVLSRFCCCCADHVQCCLAICVHLPTTNWFNSILLFTFYYLVYNFIVQFNLFDKKFTPIQTLCGCEWVCVCVCAINLSMGSNSLKMCTRMSLHCIWNYKQKKKIIVEIALVRLFSSLNVKHFNLLRLQSVRYERVWECVCVFCLFVCG